MDPNCLIIYAEGAYIGRRTDWRMFFESNLYGVLKDVQVVHGRQMGVYGDFGYSQRA